MFVITYPGLLLFITAAWIAVRTIIGIRAGKVDWKREAKLLTVYICLAVIARIVYFPMRPVEGRIGTLILDPAKIFPLWINPIPFVHMSDVYKGWQINIIGNIAMFIPVGFFWPFCFPHLNTLGKTLSAAFLFPLFIEISQLPFYQRCSDVDDLILNTTGILIGATIFFVGKRLKNRRKKLQ